VPALPERLQCIAILASLLATTVPAVASTPFPTADVETTLEIELDPDSAGLTGRAVLQLHNGERFRTAAGVVPVELRRGLRPTSIRQGDREITFSEKIEESPEPSAVVVYELEIPEQDIDRPFEIVYSGTLAEDVLSGEVPGQIHNREVEAHIGPEGVYLSDDTAWYPRIATNEIEDWTSDDPPLITFEISVGSPFLLTASGNRVYGKAGPPRWRTPFALHGMAIAGGPLEEFTRLVGSIRVSAYLRPGSAGFAYGLLDAVESYLDLYQPLVGLYPYTQFVVVENFFSSGFAFPGFTLLSSDVIQMGERGLRPGYLDHELLHNWWGNGVLASRSGGHWFEALASYCANYMRPILENRPEESRAQRRNIAEGLSSNPEKGRRAVADFGQLDGVSSYIGYQKGSLVLAQLAREIGQDAMWRGLARFYNDRLGRPSTWLDLRQAFERETDRDLEAFFAYWIRGPGLPTVTLSSAVWLESTGELELTASLAEPVAVSLPLRLLHEDGSTVTRVLELEARNSRTRLPLESRPTRIEVDPDYETLRLLPPELAMPTISGITPPLPLAIATRKRDADAYRTVADAIADRFADEDVSRREGFGRRDLAKGHVLVLGDAARSRRVSRQLARYGVSFGEHSFRVSSTDYAEQGHAFLACMGASAGTSGNSRPLLCVYYGNNSAALERSYLLPFYGGNSLVVFLEGNPIHRLDFEELETIVVN